MNTKPWQEFGKVLIELLELDTSAVAVSAAKDETCTPGEKKIRICRAILDVAAGSCCRVCRENNACFGASWHLGFNEIKDEHVKKMVRKFIVEGEKLFSSYEALENIIANLQPVPVERAMCFTLCPLEKATREPGIVIFVCNAQNACRLLTLLTFTDGMMPKIKIGGPTCRQIIMYPLLSGEANISFYDYTARKLCNVPPDKLLVSIPYKKIPQMIDNIDSCTAGRAKMEYPPEFRAFLQKRLTK